MDAYSVAKVKTFVGMEGHGFNAVLMRGDKAVAFVIDDANGGEYHFDFRNPLGNPKSYKATTDEQAREEEVAFKKHVLGFIEDKEELKYGDCFAMDSFVGRLVDAALNRARLDRAAKKKTLFRIVGDEEGGWRTLGKPYCEEVQKFLDKKYPGKVECIWGRP